MTALRPALQAARTAALLLAWLALLARPTPAHAAAPTARQLHVADCAAALQTQAEALADRIQAGQEEQRPLLQQVVRAGAAFLGKAYLAGDRDEDQGHALMDAATEAQKHWPPEQLASHQASCQTEGRQLLERANVIERTLIQRLADRRMERLLALAAARRH